MYNVDEDDTVREIYGNNISAVRNKHISKYSKYYVTTLAQPKSTVVSM